MAGAYQQTSLTTFAYQAARDLGCLREGQTLSTDLMEDILAAANQWLDQLLTDQLMIPASPAQAFTLTSGVYQYTIGPNELAPNFTAARPTEIIDANIILNTTNPVLRTPLEIINVDQWSDIPIQNLQNALPTRLYYEKSFNILTGSARIFLWGAPLQNYGLELFSWDQSVLRAFPDLTTAFIYPPGYQRMIRKNLAVEIAPLMTMHSKSARMDRPLAPPADMLRLVMKQADDARIRVESYNAPDPLLITDPSFIGSSGTPGWNWLTGTATRNGRP